MGICYKMEEKFSLKWNDYQKNITTTFQDLRHESDFYDVNLVTDDQNHFSAHKVVLSSCSEYFQSILKISQHSHPLLCLEGITSFELNNVMDYIYNGEVQILQDQVTQFINVALRLKLKGLVNQDTDFPKIEDNIEMKDILQNEVDEASSKKSISISNSKKSYGEKLNIITTINSGSFFSIDELEKKLEENLVKNADGTYKCGVCGKTGSKNIRNIKNHIELHMENLSFPCNYCEKVYHTRETLRKHSISFHK